jgi:uncharacterized membrane protein YkvA (DUF1232 family)
MRTTDLPDPTAAQLPAIIYRNQQIVEERFWQKLLHYAGKVPFAEDLAAAYFCATDTDTPTRVKGILLAALAYFVLPFDAVPDILAGIGFTDDAAVIATALGLVAGHIKPRHRSRARGLLRIPPAK